MTKVANRSSVKVAPSSSTVLELSSEFAAYSGRILDAAFKLQPPPRCPPALKSRLDQFATLGAGDGRADIGWPLQQGFMVTDPPGPTPIVAAACDYAGQLPARTRLLRRIWSRKDSPKKPAEPPDTGTDLTHFLIDMAVSSGPAQLANALRIRAFLARRVVFRPDPAPLPILHPNSFLVAFGLADASGYVARSVAEALGHRMVQRFPRLSRATGRLRRKRNRPQKAPPRKAVTPAIRAAQRALDGGQWMTYWDWWLLDRLAHSLPRVNASSILASIDRIGLYLGDPETQEKPDVLAPGWTGTPPAFMEFFQKDI